MNLLTNGNKARVLRVFPEAVVVKSGTACRIYKDDGPDPNALGSGPNPRAAWKDAAQHPEVAGDKA